MRAMKVLLVPLLMLINASCSHDQKVSALPPPPKTTQTYPSVISCASLWVIAPSRSDTPKTLDQIKHNNHLIREGCGK